MLSVTWKNGANVDIYTFYKMTSNILCYKNVCCKLIQSVSQVKALLYAFLTQEHIKFDFDKFHLVFY